jgi:tRNA (cytidine/uridine-2'-O-)-methyltransferase
MNESPSLHVILVEPEIAANTGAIGRTCVAVGAKLWLVRPLGFRLDDRRVRRAGLDYWEYLEYQVIDDIHEAVELLQLSPARIWSFSTRGTRPYTDAEYQRGDVLVFGSESRGLSSGWLASQPPSRVLRIPMRPEARSLNLANVASIVVYEAIRHCGGNGLA